MNTSVSWSVWLLDWSLVMWCCRCNSSNDSRSVVFISISVSFGTLAHSSVCMFERAIVRVYTSIFAQRYPACARPTALRRLSTVEVHKNVVLTKREQTLWFTQDFPTNTSGEDPKWMRAAQERDESFISGSASHAADGVQNCGAAVLVIFWISFGLILDWCFDAVRICVECQNV